MAIIVELHAAPEPATAKSEHMTRHQNNSINIMEQAELRLILDRDGRKDWKVTPTPAGVAISDASGKTVARIVRNYTYWHESISMQIAYQLPGKNRSDKWPGGHTVTRALQGVLRLYAWHVETEKRATCRRCRRRRLCRAEDLKSEPVCRRCRNTRQQ